MSKSRKRSPLWNHFTEITDSTDGNQRQARCDHCYSVFSIGNGCTGNLARHLRTKHPAVVMLTQGENLEESDLNETEVEYQTEDGQKFKEVYVVSNNTDDEDPDYQEVKQPPRKKSKPYRYSEHSENINNTHTHNRSTRSDSSRSHIFGKLVALKMRDLENTQRLIAEKIINDTLHEAEMGTLNKYCGLSVVEVQRAEARCERNESVDKSVMGDEDKDASV